MENGQNETKAEKQSDTKTEKQSGTPEDPAQVKEDDAPASVENDNETPQDSVAKDSDLELLYKIKCQVEFYFGDINMQKDRFLIEQAKLDEGWVPMTVMLNFKMLASMSTDINVILKALESSDLMEISDDKKKIRRSPKHPLPVYNEEYRKAQEARTIFAKGFPQNDMSIQKLKTYFEQFEPFENIIMRKYTDKEKKLHFKGSIFIQFKTIDDAKAFMARESVKYGDTELIRMWSADHAASKAQANKEQKQKRSHKNKKNDNAQVEGEEQDDKEEKKSSALPKGSLIQFSGLPEESTREDMKELLVDNCGVQVAFIDYRKGNGEGWVRLQGENAAKPCMHKMIDGKLKINDNVISFRIVDGEEEEKYLALANEKMASTRLKIKRNRKGRVNRKRPANAPSDAGSAKRRTAE